MERLIQNVPWSIILLLCIVLGLAPFSPRPHLVEKLQLLIDGQLTGAVDIFDLFFHGAGFLLLAIKIYFHLIKGGQQ